MINAPISISSEASANGFMSASEEEKKEENVDSDQIRTIKHDFLWTSDPLEVTKKVNQVISTSDSVNLKIEILAGKLENGEPIGRSKLVYSGMGNFLKALANKQVTELKILTENIKFEGLILGNQDHIASIRNFLTGHILKKDGFIGITGNNDLHGNSSILANTI